LEASSSDTDPTGIESFFRGDTPGRASFADFSGIDWLFDGAWDGYSPAMAATESRYLALGMPLPAFRLPLVSGNGEWSTDGQSGKATLVIFLCAHCPYVVHVVPELARIARDYASGDLEIVGVTSNDTAAYPQDAPTPTHEFASRSGLEFPIVFDEDQSVARAFSAACTPDFYLFSAAGGLVYHGQMDDSRPMRGPDRPGRGTLNGADLRAALDAELGGLPPLNAQLPSIGCSIKWKPGNEPTP
jgi:peroxiredoxin